MDFLCEHVVERKKEGLYRFKKAAIISAWIILPVVFIIVCLGIGSMNKTLIFLKYSIFLTPLFVFLGAKFGPITAAYGDVSYEYSIASGEMSFAKIFGDRFRREWFSFTVSKMEKCAPLSDSAMREYEDDRFVHTYRAVSSMKNKDKIYFAVFRDKNDDRCIVYFEAVKKSLRMIKTYFPATVMTNLPD